MEKERWCDFEELGKRVADQFALGSHSIHGPSHWRRVESNGLWLADRSGGDLFIVRLFAWFHDSRRMNDHYDPDHGKRGADFALTQRGSLFDMEDSAFDALAFACIWHTDRDHTDDTTIGCCWDADRLDLGRAGIIPSPALMSTAAGIEAARDGRHRFSPPRG